MASLRLESSTSSIAPAEQPPFEVPIIDDNEPLVDVVRKLHNYLVIAINDVACTFEELRFSPHAQSLRLLLYSLAENSHNPCIIAALMILKWQFTNDAETDWGLNESRGYACEYVAWQFLCHVNQRETIEFLLEELKTPMQGGMDISQAERGTSGFATMGNEAFPQEDERTPLLLSSSSSLYRFFGGKRRAGSSLDINEPGSNMSASDAYELEKLSRFFGLNALEIATIAHAKRFLSQKVVQKVIDNIWKGEIVFWDSLSVHSKKKPQFFNKRTADPYSRLRVPVYRKAFEAAFFVSFLFLYYAVLVERKPTGIGIFETMMYIWIAAFAYDEVSGMADAGMLFYQMDFWSAWNMGIIGTGLAFVIARIIGLAKQSDYITDLSFDILSLEALFLVPRICSLVSLNSYFGSLIPVLKEMTKAFFRFIPIVVVLYLGFLTTFTMLARDRLSLRQMSWILVKVFFGSNVLGFDIAHDISPIFGYGLMLIFVSMTNLLLISSLVSLMSMSLEGVMAHAREEYLFQLSIYVLESSNSRRLTYFMPPLNLIPLLCIRPMRLFLPAEHIRRVRIVLLRATHLPFVALIWAYESSRRYVSRGNSQFPPTATTTTSSRPTSSIQMGFPFSTHHAPLHASALEGRSWASSRPKERSNPGQHPETRGPSSGLAGRGDTADMIDEVERLRTQVDRVAARMAFHQRSQ
ncbi:uncharacterized protein BO88DRAFT_492310 [Aspergillus vadensis CBS 113365]|uniref:Calcium channel YVC1-like C-terminal transmembrane domain-containing protein n=1 Tax=Aspergillus vadensis (strain CBS 113365 / IMI 142717 / IBT 24658) TaxID=1448311 RepID=A0A319AZE7_ASPVC|nr:hypothetical protein BO88DRAFT_492310 [Aspergillus vadensis CBS 113365]PYH63260.1 hypothetical protein BO88DRAFT_492310 [Aspergillus vadensis CBS 113365]